MLIRLLIESILDTTFSCYIQQIQNNQIQHFCFLLPDSQDVYYRLIYLVLK
jgi:hypothetical protein